VKKLLIFTILVSFDLIIKYLVYSYIDLYRFIKITNFLDITHIHNFGISFGLFSGVVHPLILVIIALLVIIFVTYLLFISQDNLEFWGLFIVLCGAIANIIDRLINGYVIDFIFFHVNQFYWPAFNFADIYISIGIMMIILNMIRKINMKKK